MRRGRGVWGRGGGVIVTPRNGAHPMDCTGVVGPEVSCSPTPGLGFESVGKNNPKGPFRGHAGAGVK